MYKNSAIAQEQARKVEIRFGPSLPNAAFWYSLRSHTQNKLHPSGAVRIRAFVMLHPQESASQRVAEATSFLSRPAPIVKTVPSRSFRGNRGRIEVLERSDTRSIEIHIQRSDGICHDTHGCFLDRITSAHSIPFHKTHHTLSY